MIQLRKAMPLRRAGLALLILGATFADGALAQSCVDLSRELMRLERNGAGAGDSRYERAYREQFAVLNNARRAAEANSCYGGGFLFFKREPRPVCASILPKIENMEANLAKLDRLRRGGGGGGDPRAERQAQQVRALMSRLNCGRGDITNARWRNYDDIFEDDYLPERTGAYRTLCVRSCDGYYFPISFSTSQLNFSRDEAMCKAVCPGADVSLYYHSNPSGDSENMVSLAGVPYSQMKNAFAYRERYDESCSCRSGVPGQYGILQTAAELAAPGGAAPTAPEKPAFVPLPRARTGPAEDIETAMNRDAGFVPRPVVTAATAVSRTTVDPDGRTVRVVGPQYWGNQSSDQMLLIPVPN